MATLYSFKNKNELSVSLAEYVKKVSAEAIARHGKCMVAISGGSLPKMLAQELITEEGKAAVEWSKWEVFFADERAVPLDHEDSNYRLNMEELFSKLPMDPSQVHPIDASLISGEDGSETDTTELADAYEKVLVKCFAPGDAVRHPTFDLVLLGMGPDGHCCSLFPGHELLRESVAWVVGIDDSPKPPSKRITLTLPIVGHANKIAFVAAGEGKRDMLRRIIENPEEGLPCTLVNITGGEKVSWFVDDEASQDITHYPIRKELNLANI
ncbi:6-phosphogluconolactonase [Saitoella complicata NRRL Y-17804]|uniref:6-phosphogluconolactonase n=1 Tax=Saitoella complicata (strain BCRC 22490 / CBS 7301 / JCM 7358 / NBRC 10748 / NRRL Y-17804) TaxID=698492 RepID=A0A0E9NM21_SAICN|nr:6-phosphogluconolactonase [Saitoella complicata NRRL Y-17804]ODQ55493.1 6-phosphogluconolactonase [Saitoella complicata NRRL Y-17804]GAO50746.1 hypothetical protein G7K_4867-t1 [Saitoella complicata NRRL Y-17804]